MFGAVSVSSRLRVPPMCGRRGAPGLTPDIVKLGSMPPVGASCLGYLNGSSSFTYHSIFLGIIFGARELTQH